MAILQTMTYYIHSGRDIVVHYLQRLGDAIRSDKKGWLICACVLIITVVRSGITYSFGVFVVKLEATYHRPLAEQNWIGTLSFCISLSFAPLSVAFIRCLKYRGYRICAWLGTIILTVSCMASSFVGSIEWMFLTHSLLYGIGSSLIYMASSLVIGEYFDKDHRYHVLATSILLCGYPIGSLLFNPINAWLVTKFGWRVAFRFASVLIFLSGMTCSWTFSSKEDAAMSRLEEEPEDPPTPVMEEKSIQRPPLDRVPTLTEEERNKLQRRCCTWAEVKERPEIVLWYLGNMLSYLGFFMPFLNLAYYMELKDIPPTKSSWALTLLSFAECITYVFASFLGDWFKGKLVYVNVIAAGALAIICLFWPVIDVSYTVICFISMAMGGFLGLTIVYTYAASGEVTHLPIDIAWSFTNLWCGLGILVGPFFSGAIYDFRKSYDDVFYVVGVLYLFDVFIFAAIPGLTWWRQRQASKMEYNDIDALSQQHTQTYRITKRSFSKSSLVNGDAGDTQAHEYGTIGNTAPPPARPPPPPQDYLERQSSRGSFSGVPYGSYN